MGVRGERLATKADLERAINALTWRVVGAQLLTASIIVIALKFL